MAIKFEYQYIESDKDRAYIKMKTREIKMLLPKMPGSRVPGEDYFTIGNILLEMKSRITPKALFYAWIATEVEMSKDIAAKYMKIVRVFGDKYNTTKHVPYTTLHELTYPSYPSFILERIEAGGYVPSLDKIQEIRAEHDLQNKINASWQSFSPDIKANESTKVTQDVTREIETLREDLRIAEQERDMLIASIKKIIGHENNNTIKR